MAATGVVFNKFPAAAVALHESVAEVVADTTIALANEAQNDAPIDTGFLRSSIYSHTWDAGSTYGDEAGTPPGSSYLLPEADGPANDLEGVAGVAANYGGYVNYGTRFMAAQPFWEPAIAMARNTLDNELNSIEPRIAGKIG